MKRTLTRAGVLVGLLALTAVASCGSERDAAIEGLQGVKLIPPHPKVDFTLDDTQGKPFHFVNDTKGMVTLLYFGYTKCPDICPVHLANIATALRQLEPTDQAKVRVVFVTTDPNRDTPEVLRAWLDNFDKRFIGLRGGLDSVNAIQSQFGLGPASVEPMGTTGAAGGMSMYGMGHAAQVLAFSADDSLRTEYPSGFKVSSWVNDIPKLARIR